MPRERSPRADHHRGDVLAASPRAAAAPVRRTRARGPWRNCPRPARPRAREAGDSVDRPAIGAVDHAAVACRAGTLATSTRQRVGGPSSARRAAAPRSVRPVVRRAAGDRRDIVARLARQPAAAREPRLHARRTAVVGRSRKPEIAEAPSQVVEQFGGLRDRLLGIERVGEPALGGGPRHELRHALRALRGWWRRAESCSPARSAA